MCFAGGKSNGSLQLAWLHHGTARLVFPDLDSRPVFQGCQLPVVQAQMIQLLGLLTGNGDMNIDNLLVRLEDDLNAIAELWLIDSENTLLAKSAVIEDYNGKWCFFDQTFGEEGFAARFVAGCYRQAKTSKTAAELWAKHAY